MIPNFFRGAAPVLRRLFARRIVLASALVLLLVLAVAVFFPMLSDADPGEISISKRLNAPSWLHLAGTDELGRDVMLRIVYGARYSLAIGFVTAAGAVLCGTLLGMLAGFFRRLDAPLMRLVDAMMSFPDILLELSTHRTRPGSVIVGFAAETGDETGSVLEHARAKLARKGCDLLVVNDVSGGAVFGSPETEAVILAPDGGAVPVPRGSKTALAHAIWDQVLSRF